jgi:ADP-ribose pyrophosphatase YjhB (NUDIX family)
MSRVAESGMAGASPAADPRAPYARLAVVGLICRTVEDRCAGGGAAAGQAGGADAGEARWLLLHRIQPFEAWDPPGGRMEGDEDLTRAVMREVEEETGLVVEVGGPCYAFLTFYRGERLLAVSMACRPVSDPDTIRLEAGGAAGWQWVTGKEWEQLAAGGISSWDPADVRKATGTVAAIWEAVQG